MINLRRPPRRHVFAPAYLVLALLLQSDLPVRAAGVDLRVDISGMVGVIPAKNEDAVRVVAVNSSDAEHAHHGLLHSPALVVPCTALVSANQAQFCTARTNGWISSPWDSSQSAFDLRPGYDVSLHDSKGPLATGLKTSAQLKKYLVDLSKFGSDAATPNPYLSDAATKDLVDLVSIRVALRAGSLAVGDYEQREDWSFIGAKGVVKDTKQKLASVLEWLVPVAEDSVFVVLTSFDGSTSTKLELKPMVAGQQLVISIQNEPTKDDFCQHEPTLNDPFVPHFTDFRRLAADPAAAEIVHPRYDGSYQPCHEGYTGRPPIMCMASLFNEATQDW